MFKLKFLILLGSHKFRPFSFTQKFNHKCKKCLPTFCIVTCQNRFRGAKTVLNNFKIVLALRLDT
jgi:hypothetical protein